MLRFLKISHQYIATFLVFVLIVSQTIHVDFFYRADASQAVYRDIVSVFVDSDTYKASRAKINRYAEDIQSYLGSTQVSLYIIDDTTPVQTIAAQNEKLYYEGTQSNKVDRLVGVILLGNIPMPMVSTQNDIFPSIYPYVDFVDKQFVYDDRSGYYRMIDNPNQKVIEPEIWHGVINPAVGRKWDRDRDISKIDDFLDKTHDFYTQQGVFAPSSIPPRVFYYDGFAESAATDQRSLFQYGLSMKNSENIAYNRFTKYLLTDINTALQQFDTQNKANDSALLKSFGLNIGSDTLDSAAIATLPDVQTEAAIKGLIKDFYAIINKKTLGDQLLAVRNAGRYSSEDTVRADIAATIVTTMDTVARSVLSDANASIMESIDSVLNERGYAKKIPIFDTFSRKETVQVGGSTILTQTGVYGYNDFVYQNYYFGQKSTLIRSPEQCTIARGSNDIRTDFGRSILTESNVMYDISLTESHAAKLEADTTKLIGIHRQPSFACFDSASAKPKTLSYWGNNSMLSLATSVSANDIFTLPPNGTAFTGMTESVFSLNGMKESTRISPASIADCISNKYQYALEVPMKVNYVEYVNVSDSQTPVNCTRSNLSEWNIRGSGFFGCSESISSSAPDPLQYSCLSKPNILPGVRVFSEDVARYNNTNCLDGGLSLNGNTIIDSDKSCITTLGSGEDSYTVDNTIYESVSYHTIPSLLRHVSPTSSEIEAAKNTNITPSLPIDMVRYVEFLTPKGNIARINYPNFFTAEGDDIATFRNWLREKSKSDWDSIIAKENSTALTANDIQANQYLGVGVLPANPIDWNVFISDEVILKIIQARNWLTPDITQKYITSIENMLSYSQNSLVTDVFSAPNIPRANNSYEVAYLGLSPFSPNDLGSTNTPPEQVEYSGFRSRLRAINISEESAKYDPPDSAPSDNCGPPDGVSLFQWPSAIVCWIKSLTPIRIVGMACGANTIGMKHSISAATQIPTNTNLDSFASISDFYTGGKLVYNLASKSIFPNANTEIEFYYVKDNKILGFPKDTKIELELSSFQSEDGKILNVSNPSALLDVLPRSTIITEQGGKFLLSSSGTLGKARMQASVSLTASGAKTFKMQSDEVVLHISPEYIDIVSSVDQKISSTIPVTNSSGMTFDFSMKSQSRDATAIKYPLSLNIYDEVGEIYIATGIIVPSQQFVLPKKYTQQVGVYRLDFQDEDGKSGSHSIAVQVGPLSRVNISPISSSILRGSNTPVIVQLRDAVGNPISPELHTVDISVDAGYIIMKDGQRRTNIRLDSMESDISFVIGSDVSGTVGVTAKVDDRLQATSSLSVFENAHIVLSREGISQVGAGPQKVILKVQGSDKNTLVGFHSVAHLSLPQGAGTFVPNVVSIRDGISQEFQFVPGQLAGEHNVTVSIPGLGIVPDIGYAVSAGSPLYVSHTEQGEELIFSLRDRYDNIAPVSLTGSIQINTEAKKTIDFVDGRFSHPKTSGIASIQVPSLSQNIVIYGDSSGSYTLTGSQYYTAYIAGTAREFDFHDDYNARYTVLAGGAFLREAEDILFDADPKKSQSLAVTTLLDSPYVRDSIVSFFPGGRFQVNNTSELAVEASLTLEDGYPLVSFRDSVSQSLVVDGLYRATNPSVDICSAECSFSPKNSSHIVIQSYGSSASVEKLGSTASLMQGGDAQVTIYNNGKIQYRPGIELQLNEEEMDRGIIIDIISNREVVGKIYYRTHSERSIIQRSSIVDNPDTILVRSYAQYSLERIGVARFSSGVEGLRVMSPSNIKLLDRVKNGPETIDSLGMIAELPGVGWQGSNRMLLSYAGGDTVGESSRWFHTFTMINLGDPVAHNDHEIPGTHFDGLDKTLGTQLTSNNASPVQSYLQADMNNDGYEDIVVLRSDGYIELLLNLVDRVRSRGNIAYIPDIVSRGFSIADFTGDGFGDILGVDKDGDFVLIANDNRRFSRTGIAVQAGASIPRSINQFQTRDMDQDGLDDIVYITQAGELGILYATNTSGLYKKDILDSTLGITLSDTPIIAGGAIYADHIPQVSLASSSSSSELDESRLYTEVYYPFGGVDTYKPNEPIDTSTASGVLLRDNELAQLSQLETSYQISSDNSQSITNAQGTTKNYIRSEYSETQGVSINKTYKNIAHSILRTGDTVRVSIEIKNTTTKTIKNIEYLDTIPRIFDASKTKNYTMVIGSNSITRDFIGLSYSDFDAYFSLLDITAGDTLTLTYDLEVLPASYGELLVGDYERGEVGQDAYGDIAFQTDTTCGADMMLWRSEGPRSYIRGTRSFSDSTIPANIAQSLTDVDNNGIPDSIDNMTLAEQKNLLNTINKTTTVSGKNILNVNLDENRQMLDIGFDEGAVANIQNTVKNILDGLACGFGGGSCMSFPINWAPLAPGSAPVAFGYPLSSLTPSTGKPVFSALTCQLVTFSCGTSPCTFGFPSVFPASRMGANMYGLVGGANNGAACGNASQTSGAGGSLGTSSLMNSIRIYATPTLTLGAGAAFCFGQPLIAGNTPPQAVWPLMNGGNCIVVAKPMSMCKDDGSIADGDVRGISGLGTTTDAWNAGSCHIQADTGGVVEDEKLRKDIVSYIKSPNKTQLTGLYNRLGSRTPKTITGGPLLRMSGASSGGALTGIDITLDSAKPLDLGNIVKLNNKRISGFPDFIMDWVARQTDQITNSLLTPPNLIIIPPTSVGQNAQFDGSIAGFTDTFKDAYNQSKFDNITKKSGEIYANTIASESATNTAVDRTKSSKNNAQSDLGKWMNDQQNNFDALQDSAFKSQVGKIANEGKGGIAAMRAAYKLVGKLPLISISEKTIPVDVPWILPQELDRYARSLDVYSRELDSTLESFCIDDPSPECAAEKGRLEASGLRSSINQNLKIIEEYKNFPIKLQKYVTWKQRYLSQVLCYITEVQQMTTGWVKDNSIRFQKWAELVVLIRAIADSWQPILDIVAQKNAQCQVCRNERYNAKYFKYKIISALIPSIPVIQFPRWPDIVLDLSDVRLGIVLMVPNFQFNLKPIRLPDLPRFTLPRAPGLSLTLPTINLLPPIPALPDLPDLPSIPTIKLPNLPPPPKLPKLFASLGVGLNILKLFQIMECYVNQTTLVPEWTVGDVIAQRTERQGTLPIDFLDISLPQFSIPSIREIRVSSHVNFDIRSEFVAEFAQAAVAPINNFNADLGRGIPKKIGDDVRIDAPKNINLKLESSHTTVEKQIALLQDSADIFLSIDEFRVELLSQFESIPEFSHLIASLEEQTARTQKDAQSEEKKLLAYNDQKFQKLHTYIQKQYDETAQIQNIIDLLQSEDSSILAQEKLERALLVSDAMIRSSEKLAQDWNKESLNIGDSVRKDDGLTTMRDNISSRLGRLAATIAPDSTASQPISDLASGYAPNYKGIYIITEGGNQTRLFDYTELVRPDDSATRLDIDKDGDMDYLFLLDGILYLKKSNLRNTTKIIDTTLNVKDISHKVVPTAPDFFHEDGSLSNIFAFSYQTTRDTDNIWRIEFYDRYMEWDMLKQGTHDSTATPMHMIELVDAEKTENNKTLRILERVDDSSGFVMEGPKVEILTGTLDFVVAPGRILYAGDRGATVLYSTGSDTPYIRKTLTPSGHVIFDETTNISLRSGKIFIVYPSTLGQTYTYSEDLVGMPIVPGMRIASGVGSVTLRDTVIDEKIVLPPASTYRYTGISSQDRQYSVRIPHPNGYFFPKIQQLYGHQSTSAGEILFAPNASSDISAPLVDIASSIRIPVYQTREIYLKDIINEMSDYEVSIDTDITVDADANGIYDDDYNTTSTGVTITNNSIIFGPFDTIGNINMMMKVQDEFHNTTIVQFPVEIYPPVPSITLASATGSIEGSIDESLSSEPIDIFRVRTGMDIVRVNSPTSIRTDERGVYSTIIDNVLTGARITYSGSSVQLSDRGILENLPTEYKTEFRLADIDNPMHLILRNASGAALYRQFFVLPDTVIFLDKNEYKTTGENTAVFITTGETYKMIAAPIVDPSIPRGMYIIDDSYSPLVAIARDGNIYPIAPGVTAIMNNKDGYPQITLKKGNNSFADVLYKFDFFYTLK